MADPLGYDRLLRQVQELERRDREAAARLAEAADALRAVDEIRSENVRIRHAMEALPAEREHTEGALREAAEREMAARDELADAERHADSLEGSRRAGADARAQAAQALQRAAVAATDATAATTRLRGQMEALAAAVGALRAEGDALARDAHRVAAAVAVVPRVSDSGKTVPGDSLDAIENWGARTHAALFLVCRSFEEERERIVIEANALTAVALGEQVAGSNVALLRRRLENRAPSN